MNRRNLLCTAAAFALLLPAAAIAQERGQWRAASSTAKAITGDITFAGEKIAIENFYPFTIAEIRDLKPAELAAAFNAEASAQGRGNLYRTSIPADRKFLHKNTLCGSEETQWLATYVQGRTLQIAFFSGAAMPVFTPEALADSPSLCGTYSYTR